MNANGYDTQESLSIASGVHQSLISRILHGHSPSLRICKKLSDAFKAKPISAADLYRSLHDSANSRTKIR